MTALQRPPHCPYCDASEPNSAECVGVSVSPLHGPGKYKRICSDLRDFWDAGHAAGARSERAAQAVQESQARINIVTRKPGT